MNLDYTFDFSVAWLPATVLPELPNGGTSAQVLALMDDGRPALARYEAPRGRWTRGGGVPIRVSYWMPIRPPQAPDKRPEMREAVADVRAAMRQRGHTPGTDRGEVYPGGAGPAKLVRIRCEWCERSAAVDALPTGGTIVWGTALYRDCNGA